MYSSEVVVFVIRTPFPKVSKRSSSSWRLSVPFCHLGSYQLYFKSLVTFWHNEPEDRDSDTVCTGMGGSELTWHNVKWAFEHRKHLEIHFEPYLKLKRFIKNRCASCGKRFGYNEAAYGYDWHSTEVYHRNCWIDKLPEGVST